MKRDAGILVERVQTGVRLEKRLLKVLKAFAEYHDLTLGDLLEGIVLHAFDGKIPFTRASLERIKDLKKFYGLELNSTGQPSPERGREKSQAIPMTDHELIEQFENGTLPDQCFHHREHVRTAFLYLTRYPVLEALAAFSNALRRFAELRGKPQLYHQTDNLGLCLSYSGAHGQGRKATRAGKNLPGNNPDLLVWKDGILTRFYRPERSPPTWPEPSFCCPTCETLPVRRLKSSKNREDNSMYSGIVRANLRP